MADHLDRAGHHVVRVVGGLIELERFSGRRVIPRNKPSDAHMLCSAIHGAVWVSGAEAATEPAPSDAIVVQECDSAGPDSPLGTATSTCTLPTTPKRIDW